jgi:phosphatidate cytidylyltransferase
MLWPRILSGLVLAPVVMASAIWGGVLFDILVALSAYLGAQEWSAMVQPRLEGIQKQRFATALPMAIIVLAVAGIQADLQYFPVVLGLTMLVFALYLLWRRWSNGWCLFLGLPYLGATLLSLIALRRYDPKGWWDLVVVFVAVWLTDTVAYGAGRIFKGPKLVPAISPNKTWAGAVGGTAGGVAGVVITFAASGSHSLWQAGLIGLALSLATQLGDLLESAAKRAFGVKDSGWLIPGHGGILDRIDGLLLAAPVFACYRFLGG